MVGIGFSSLYHKRLSNVYSVEKVRSLGMRERIPLKKDRIKCERRALMVRTIAKEKNTEKFPLIAYFHLSFSTA